MKKNLKITVAVVSLVFASMSFASAADSTILRVNVPFAFQAGKVSLPAGEYIVEIQRASNGSALGTALTIRTPDAKTHYLVSSRPAYDVTDRASLTFNKYGNAYFLTSVDSFGVGCELNKSAAEKEMAGKAHASPAVSVAAE